MKKNFFIPFLTLLCLFSFSLLPMACSDDDDAPDSEEVIDDEYDPEAQLIRDSLHSAAILSELAAYDSISGTYTPHLGTAIYPEHPDWYYLMAESVDEAREYFTTMFCDSTVQSGAGGVLTSKFIDGSLTFNPTSTADQVASIDVNVPVIPSLKKFVFIRSSEWPTNNTNDMKWGQVWRRTCKGTGNGWLYFVAADCNSSSDNVRLITFDGGWDVDKFRAKTHWQGAFDVYCNCASKATFEGLHRYVTRADPKGKILKDMAMTEKLKDTRLYCMLKGIYDKDQGLDFNVGTHKWGKHLWRAYYCYDVTIYYYSARDRKFWDHYYTHKETPCNGGAGWVNRNNVADPKYGVSSEYLIPSDYKFGQGTNDAHKVCGSDAFDLVLDNYVD